MRHGNRYRKLGRRTDHRKAMLRNLASSFFLGEQIRTTVPKAKELRSIVEKIITLGKRGDVHARRLVASYLFDANAVRNVFGKVAPRHKERNGGYTRIIKLGTRFGDGAELASLEMVDFERSTETKT